MIDVVFWLVICTWLLATYSCWDDKPRSVTDAWARFKSRYNDLLARDDERNRAR